jgi:hypothetical protein
LHVFFVAPQDGALEVDAVQVHAWLKARSALTSRWSRGTGQFPVSSSRGPAA